HPIDLYTLALHDALPIFYPAQLWVVQGAALDGYACQVGSLGTADQTEKIAVAACTCCDLLLQFPFLFVARQYQHTRLLAHVPALDRKSTRLNSSHVKISY